MTLVISGDIPHFDMTHCSNVTIVGCGGVDRCYTLSMSCFESIVTSLQVSVGYKSAARVDVLMHSDHILFCRG